MSLTIGLADRKVTVPYPSLRVSFDDDGYYWFCYSFFERLAQKTGQMIDLYGGAWFDAQGLDELESTVHEILEKANRMPTNWAECIGHNVGSYIKPINPPEPIYASVERDRLIQLLENFRSLVSEAKRDGKWVACLGD